MHTYQSSIRLFRLFHFYSVNCKAKDLSCIFITRPEGASPIPFKADSVRRSAPFFKPFPFFSFSYSLALGASFSNLVFEQIGLCYCLLLCLFLANSKCPHSKTDLFGVRCSLAYRGLLWRGRSPAAASANCSRRLSLQGPTCRDGLNLKQFKHAQNTTVKS